MLQIDEKKLSEIIHNLLNIVCVIKAVETNHLTKGQRQILHGTEIRLQELRQDLVEAIKNNNNGGNNNGNNTG